MIQKFLFFFRGAVGDKVGAHKDENVSCVTRQRWRNILAAVLTRQSRQAVTLGLVTNCVSHCGDI